MTTPNADPPPPSASAPPPVPPRPGLGRALTAAVLAALAIVLAVAVVLVYLSTRSAPDPQAGTSDTGVPDPLPERSLEAWCAAREQLTGLTPADLDDPDAFREEFEQVAAGNLTLGALAPSEIRAESDVIVELWTQTIEQIDRRGGWQDPAQAMDVLGELIGAEQQAAIEAVENFAAERCP